jgi:hypothetical protein
MDFKQKYLKYKKKYLELKGGESISFQDKTMEKEIERSKNPLIIYQTPPVPTLVDLKKSDSVQIFKEGRWMVTQYIDKIIINRVVSHYDYSDDDIPLENKTIDYLEDNDIFDINQINKPNYTRGEKVKFKDFNDNWIETIYIDKVEKHRIIDIYDENDDSPLEDRMKEYVDIDQLRPLDTINSCDKIISLLHGTPIQNIINILTEDVLKIGKGETSGVKTNAISTCPILNCDIDKYYPISRAYGDVQIFLNPILLDEHSWKLSVETDSVAGGEYNKGNIEYYFNVISPIRYLLYNDPKRQLDEMKVHQIDKVMGELSFSGVTLKDGIKNIKKYIQFITVKNFTGSKEKTTVVEQIRAMGIKVFEYNKESLWLEDYFFE